jgi:transposase InsO family protein
MMRADNLLSIRKNKFILPTTDSNHTHRVYPNLARNTQLTAPNQLWVADITYVQLREEEVYLAVVLDVYTRVVVGWAVRGTFVAELVVAALEMALANRPAPHMHHSDQGVQYASQEYVTILENRKVTISMSRPGTPTDNAYCESFIKTLKAEQLDGKAYRDLEELAPVLPSIINVFYNQKHLHSALGYRTPAEFEQSLRPDAASGGGVF